jgi:hypothetical protein
MTIELAIAGLGCFVLAFGHTAVGVRSVGPALAELPLPARIRTMLRFTWDVVTVFLVAVGGLLVSLAVAKHAEPRTLLLRWFAALWLVAALRASWDARRRPSRLVRFPVALVFVLIAAMCMAASV